MRTNLLPAILLATAASSGACIWTEFDELRDDVWVDSVGAIENSSKFGEAVMEATAGAPTAGTTIGVLGRNQASVSFVTYTGDGQRDIHTVDLTTAFMLVNTFDENPVYAADPNGDGILAAALTGSLSEQPNLRGLKVGFFHGATFQGVNPGFEPPVTLGNDPSVESHRHDPPTAAAFGGSLEALVGRKGQLLHVGLAGTPGDWVACAMADNNEAAYAIAFGDVDGVAGNEWVIASAPVGVDAAPDNGRVWIVPDTSVFGDAGAIPPACPVATKEVVSGGTGIPLGAGSQIAIAPNDSGFGAGPRVVVSSPGAGGKLSIIDFTPATPTLTQLASPGVADLDSFVLADVAGANPGLEIVVGAPLADRDGTTRAGEVRILAPDGTAVAEPLADADPETEQHFGKTVAVVPFGQRQIIIVGAEGEVFTYFRTSFYDEVRSGRTP
jgi:hypothetical protein